MNKIVKTTEDFLEMVKRAEPRTLIIYDEAGIIPDDIKWQEDISKQIQEVFRLIKLRRERLF